MAKTSSIEKNERRRRMAKKYSAKRAKLKAIVYDKKLPIEDRFAAGLKLAAIAAQFGAEPHPQPLRDDRPAARLLPQAEDLPHRAPRTGLQGPDSRSREVELVRRRR